MFNRRALLCVVVSAAIVLFAARPSLVWRNPGIAKPWSPVAEQEVGDSSTLVLAGRDGPVTVSARDIEAILAAENYVEICMSSGKQYLHRTTLAKIERELSSDRMLRVHRSAIVNVDQVRSKLPGWRLQLTSGREIRVGRSFRDAVDKSIDTNHRSANR
jgi:DNA-binding LytR/AlgR family response regulator